MRSPGSVRRLRLFCTASLLLGAVTLGCGTVRQQATTGPRNPAAAPRALFAQEGLSILGSRWVHAGDLAKRQLGVEQRMREMGAPEHVIVGTRGAARETLTLDYMVDEELKARRASYLLLRARLEPGARVRFLGSGAFMLVLTSPEGATEEVPDQGLLLFPGPYHDKFVDTARSAVTFHREFDGKPDYREQWHLIYVRLPEKYLDWKVDGVKGDSSKIAFLKQ